MACSQVTGTDPPSSTLSMCFSPSVPQTRGATTTATCTASKKVWKARPRLARAWISAAHAPRVHA